MKEELSRRSLLASTAGLLAWPSLIRVSSSRGAEMSKFDTEGFVENVKAANREKEAQAAVDEVLAKAVSEPARLIAGLGEPKEPGLHILHHSKEVTILNVAWAPLMLLMPHNHDMWASIGIYTGREDNIIWKRNGAVVEAAGAASLSEKEVFPLPEDAIHSVSNPIPRLTGAIHIYGGDFFDTENRSEWDPETLREQPLDLEAAQARFREANERFHGR